MNAYVRSLISSLDDKIERPIKDVGVFVPIIRTLLEYIRDYKPEENRDYILNEVHYEFSCYLEAKMRNKDISAEDGKTLIDAFRTNLTNNFYWQRTKPTLAARHFRNMRLFLGNQSVMANPFKTMSPEYIYDIHNTFLEFEKYIRTPEFLAICEARMATYLKQASIESLCSGTNNPRKAEAIFKLLADIGINMSEEFVQEHKDFVDYVRKEYEVL